MVKCSVSGLDPDDNYAIVMDAISVGDNRFKFHDSEWVVTGKAEPMGNEKGRLYVHPDTPSSGAKWEKQLLTFQKCKITNNHLDQLGYVSGWLVLWHIELYASWNGWGVLMKVDIIITKLILVSLSHPPSCMQGLWYLLLA